MFFFRVPEVAQQMIGDTTLLAACLLEQVCGCQLPIQSLSVCPIATDEMLEIKMRAYSHTCLVDSSLLHCQWCAAAVAVGAGGGGDAAGSGGGGGDGQGGQGGDDDGVGVGVGDGRSWSWSW